MMDNTITDFSKSEEVIKLASKESNSSLIFEELHTNMVQLEFMLTNQTAKDPETSDLYSPLLAKRD